MRNIDKFTDNYILANNWKADEEGAFVIEGAFDNDESFVNKLEHVKINKRDVNSIGELKVNDNRANRAENSGSITLTKEKVETLYVILAKYVGERVDSRSNRILVEKIADNATVIRFGSEEAKGQFAVILNDDDLVSLTESLRVLANNNRRTVKEEEDK